MTESSSIEQEITAYIGLGSNLKNPQSQLTQALEALNTLPQSRLLKYSSLYRNKSMGPADQPDYINAVASLATNLSPYELLAGLQDLEIKQGRIRGPERWGPRSLDLDILLYGELELSTPDLIIPHPGLPDRNFVLYPLYEIAPDLEIPGRGPLVALLSKVSQQGLVRIGIDG